MKNKLFAVSIFITFILFSQLNEVLLLLPIIGEIYRGMYDLFPYPYLGELRSLLQILLVFITLSIIYKKGFLSHIDKLGLKKSFLTGLIFGAAATLPMWILFAVTAPLANEFSLNTVFYLVFLSVFAEEIIFRGFAFGQIRRKAGWGFWTSALTTALVFGVGHVSLNQNIGQSLGVFLITGAGGILFSWLYEKWDFNLWIPFFLHAFMNLNWQVFEVGNSAFAGWLPTTLQLVVVICAVILTIFKNHLPYLAKPG